MTECRRCESHHTSSPCKKSGIKMNTEEEECYQLNGQVVVILLLSQ